MRHRAFVSVLLLAATFSLLSPAPARAADAESAAHPFSQIAVGVSLGTQGIGFEAATPLVPSLSLRGGGDFLPVNNLTFASSSINYTASLALQSGQLSVDWLPFHGSFRLSPGVLFYNGSNVSATMAVAGGQTFSVNHVTYFSSATDPIHGAAGATWPKAGPRLTFGWGNMLPRKTGKHLGWTSEFGFAYFGTGTVTYNFSGTECTSTAASSCHPAGTDAPFQANVTAERATVQKNMTYARFYPIFKTGLSYRF